MRRVLTNGLVGLLATVMTACAGAPLSLAAAGPVGLQAQSRGNVKDEILADLARRRAANPAGYQRKLAALRSDAFAFFRGAAPHFYRRLGTMMPPALKAAPETLLVGDLHCENFGVVPGPAGLTYGPTDFDEAAPGPVSLDLVRCMASLVIAQGDDSLLDPFLRGYGKSLDRKIDVHSEALRDAIRKYGLRTQAEMLADRTTSAVPRQIRPDTDNQPLAPSVKAELARVLGTCGLPGLERRPMEDAVHRFGGVASLDLFRYEAVCGDGGNQDLIVEVKELLPSVLDPDRRSRTNDLARQREALKQYQGASALPVAAVKVGPYPMIVRIRPPYKGSVKLAKVKASDRAAFAEDLGKISGLGHVRGTSAAALQAFMTAQGAALRQTAVAAAQQMQSDFRAFAGR